MNILGVHVTKIDLSRTIAMMCQTIENNQRQRICVTPVNCILWARKDGKLRTVYNTSDIRLADGVPIVWASRFLGGSIPGRVTGLDLLPTFAEVAARKGYTLFFLGAKKGVGEALAVMLKQKHPSINIVGVYSPPYAEKFSDAENIKIVEMINAVKPNVLWVSLTAPKQDFWIYDNFRKLNVNIAIGVGGAFEVTAGLISRAPLWMQENGFEWLYRFLHEPKRLFRRYIIEAPLFIPLVILQKLGVHKYENH